MEYDEAQLTEAGVDLNQKLEIKLNGATTEALFRALCEPLKLDYTIQADKVILAPKKATR